MGWPQGSAKVPGWGTHCAIGAANFFTGAIGGGRGLAHAQQAFADEARDRRALQTAGALRERASAQQSCGLGSGRGEPEKLPEMTSN